MSFWIDSHYFELSFVKKKINERDIDIIRSFFYLFTLHNCPWPLSGIYLTNLILKHKHVVSTCILWNWGFSFFKKNTFIELYIFQMQHNVCTCTCNMTLVVFLLSDARKASKRQKALTNLNSSLSKTKISRLHLEDASTYWSQSFGKETTISWEKYDCVTAIILYTM